MIYDMEQQLIEEQNDIYSLVGGFKITDVQKKILIYRYLHEMTFKEIGDALNITEGQARYKEVKALKSLRRERDNIKFLWLPKLFLK